jgi:RNAse (barnase) inhibitor barstar
MSGRAVAEQGDMTTADLPELVVNMTHIAIHDWADLWEALSELCGLPSWFGRNLDTWWDTIEGRQISPTVDRHFLVIQLRATEFFRTGDGVRFVETTNESDFARAIVA